MPSNVNIYIFNPGCSGSSREALGRFCKQFKQVTIFDSDVNRGISFGRNFLITHTTEEWLLFVDNDVTVRTSDWLERFQDYRKRYPDTEVFIPRIFISHEDKYLIPAQLTVNERRVLCGEQVDDHTRNAFPGGAVFAARRLFDRLGLFDERLYAFEDFELCLRGIFSQSPVRAILAPDIEFVHKHELARNEKDRQAALIRYDYERIEKSYAWIVEKHGVHFPDDWRQWVASQRKLVLDERESRTQPDN